uniref:Putative transmembrane protein n=1 Tax=Serpentovirinae sp. TaxID=2661817 RepID=A0A5P9K4W9_9NIDO|nr:putative transmembrane protein [Serpentovirinae sp.]
MKYLIVLTACLFFKYVLSTSSTTLSTSPTATSTVTAATTSSKSDTTLKTTITPKSERHISVISSTIKQSVATTQGSLQSKLYMTNCYCTNYCQVNVTDDQEVVADGVVSNGTVLFWESLITMFQPEISCVIKVETCSNKNYPTTSACLVAFSAYKPTNDCKTQQRLRNGLVPVCESQGVITIGSARKLSAVREVSFDTSQQTSGAFLASVVLISCLSTIIIVFAIRGAFVAGANITIKQPKQRFY